MKWGSLVAGILVLALLLGCSPKAPVSLPPSQETPPPAAPQETLAPSPIMYTLTVTAVPTNGGSINLSPAGSTYTSGTIVTLTATPASGYTFDYWDGAASGSSHTVTIIMNSNKSTTAHFKVVPTPTPPTPTGPYTGTLFDTHLHLHPMYRGTPEELSSMKLKSGRDLLNYLDRNKVDSVIGFYTFPANKSSRNWVPTAETIIRDTKSRVIPLLHPAGDGGTSLASGEFTETVLRQYLQPQGLLQGVGEIALYTSALQGVTFDSPQMQTIFKVVNELKGIVMVHPSNVARGGRPTVLSEIETSVRKYPDAIFLFHGQPEIFDVVAQLMANYPNVYFTMDATNWLLVSRVAGYNLLYPEGAYGSLAGGTAERFLADVNRTGFDRLVEDSLTKSASRLRQYPDRVFWGTDFDQPWHFEDSVTDMVVKISRAVIGRLPADIQQKYAYKNAQRVFGRFLTPNP